MSQDKIFEIKRLNGEIIFSGEAESLRDAVEKNVTNLGVANLGGADLRGADLGGAYLGGADLRGADLRGANYGSDIPLTMVPLVISGLKWDILILDNHLKIGCALHSYEDWQLKGDEIAVKHNESAWWQKHKEAIFAVIRATRGVE